MAEVSGPGLNAKGGTSQVAGARGIGAQARGMGARASPGLGGSRPAPAPKSGRAVGATLILFILAALLLLGVQGVTLFDRFARSSEVGLDNKVWAFAQLEVEAKTLALALQVAPDGKGGDSLPPEADRRIRTAFDIYFSRTGTVSALARDTLDLPEVLAGYQDIRRAAEALAARLDAMPKLSGPELHALRDAVAADMPRLRKVTNAALQELIATAERTRQNRHRIVGQLQLLLGAVILLMIASVRQAMGVSRAVGHHAAETAMVADRLARTFNASLDAVVLVDRRGIITEHNAALGKVLGIDAPDGATATAPVIVGRRALGLVAKADRKAVLRLLTTLGAAVPGDTRAASEKETPPESSDLTPDQSPDTTRDAPVGGASGRINIALCGANGTLRPVELSCAVDHRQDGNSTFIIFVRDRAQELAAANVLRDARDRARQDAKAKERFLSVLSHEMRTPLHGVITSLELIRGKGMAPEDQGFVATASACARTALTQIDDVLALTRNGSLGDPAEAFLPARLVEDIVAEILPIALEGGNVLRFEAAGDAARTAVLSHSRSFKLAVRNLIANAVKYTANGRIDVALACRATGPGLIEVSVSVEDTGIGILPQDQARIFEEFAMVADPRAGLVTGFGLGLAIAKSSVERLQGSIGLNSGAGQGSTFFFSFEAPAAQVVPAASIRGPAPPPVMALPGEPAQDVLIVDDNPVNRALMSEMVKRLGHRPDLAANGQAALGLAGEKPFDLILMDLNMPGLDGFETARRIRADSRNSATRIVALTARDLSQDDRDLQGSGIDRAVQKPISLQGLQEVIAAPLPGKAAAAPAKGTPEGKSLLEGFHDLQGLFGPQMTRRLFDAMMQECGAALLQLGAQPAGDAGLADLAHRAGGAAAVLGAARLAQGWFQVETAARQNDRPGLSRLAQDLPVLFGQTRAALAEHGLGPAPLH